MIRVERRLKQPLWLSVAVPFASVGIAFFFMAAVLAATGHDPITTYRRLFDAAFAGSRRRWTATLMSATPLLFTGLAASVAFRMQLYNIGAEGQLYIGAICGAGAAIWLGPHHDIVFTILLMCACAAARRRALGADRRRAEGLRADERDPDDADAQLRRGAAPHVPDLRQRLALARRLDGAGALVPAGGPAGRRPVLAHLDAVRHHDPVRLPARDRRRARTRRSCSARPGSASR